MSVAIDSASIGLMRAFLASVGQVRLKDSILEAFPHDKDIIAFSDFVEALQNLEIPFLEVECRENEITRRECPALIFDAAGASSVLLDVHDGCLFLSGGSIENAAPPVFNRAASRKRCTLLLIDKGAISVTQTEDKTIASAFADLRGMLPSLLFLSFITNVLGLMIPLLIMAIYDRIIPANAETLLVALALGATLVIFADFMFRETRAQALAFVGAQSDLSLTMRLMQKLMRLPLSQMMKADVGTQIARFRQIEGMRNIFTGQVMVALLDLPFVLIFFGVVFSLAPHVGWLLLGAVAAFFVIGAICIPRQMQLERRAAEASQTVRTLQSDAIYNQATVKNLGLTDIWLDRVGVAARYAEHATARASRMRDLSQALAQALMAAATSGAIVLGTLAAIAGTMSFGSLIAVIALTGKVLGPFNALHGSLPQILSFRKSRDQADRVLKLKEEPRLGLRQPHHKSLSGKISFSGVTYRPDPLNAPVLLQVSLKITPGEIVLLAGKDFSARSAVLDLVDGLHDPLAGTIEHDDIDIRQIARDELRRSIAYDVPSSGLFFGTVEQNFRFAGAAMSRARIERALKEFNLDQCVAELPEGLETNLNAETLARMSEPTKRALALARNSARDATIYLFSEPTLGLDTSGRVAFKAWLRKTAGTRTVLVSSADQSLLDYANRHILIERGRVIVNDTGQEGAKKLKAAFAATKGSA